jgi:hypothetical protein
MRKLKLFAAIAFLSAFAAACGGSPTPALPTVNPNAATTVPTVTPDSSMADDGTAEATSEGTAESTPPPIAGQSEGTPEVAMNPTFLIQVAGDTELTIDSQDNATVADEVEGSPAQGEAAPVLNTPMVIMRYLRFMPGDQSYTFELSFSENTIDPDTYEIGVDNINTTVGNNVNEDSAGQSQASVESTAEATDDNSNDSTDAGNQQANTPVPAQDNTSGGQESGSALDTNDPGSNAPDLGITERDETFAPIIAARLIPASGDGTEYNLLLGGTLTIDAMDEAGVSGSFEFQLAPADSPEQTITVSGTFTDIPFTETDGENVTPTP